MIDILNCQGMSRQLFFSIDPRLTDTPRDFATNYGQKIFINSAYMPNNNIEIINDASYRFTKSQGFFLMSFHPIRMQICMLRRITQKQNLDLKNLVNI